MRAKNALPDVVTNKDRALGVEGKDFAAGRIGTIPEVGTLMVVMEHLVVMISMHVF